MPEPSVDDTDRVGRLTQQELLDLCAQRFGDDRWSWAFTCPTCGDVATAADFRDAGADPQSVGQECVGRHLGARGGEPTRDGGRSRATRGLRLDRVRPLPWSLGHHHARRQRELRVSRRHHR
jgi:hypothetical protein